MNDNRDEIQRLRAMRAEAINRGDFGRADAIGADLATPGGPALIVNIRLRGNMGF